MAIFTSSDPNYTNNTAQTTFTINPAKPSVSVADAGGTYTGSAFPASGKAVGTNGQTVSGSFSYAYYVGSSVSGTPSATAPSNAGTYTVVATFTSSNPNYSSGAAAQTSFTINPATPTVTVTDAGGTYDGNPFPATATIAGVDGQPADSLEGVTPTLTYYVGSGSSGANLGATAPSSAGTYTVVASFAGSSDYTSASAYVTFTINAATAAIQFASVTIVPNLLALNQTETISVYVFAAGGVAGGGMVTFTVDGQSVQASVDGNGNATASLTLPLLSAAFLQSLNAAYNGPDANGTATATAFWNVLDALVLSIDTFAADGSQSVQSFLFNLPLLDFLYTSWGQLTQVVLGPNLLNWDYSYSPMLTVVTLDGVLPVEIVLRTPQGQLLGAVQLTVSADGTPVIESIDAQGQVVPA